ncbi:MAG: hypothetical protein ACREO2_09590, partial [Arenimonas sp.]
MRGRIALQIRDQNETPILSSASTDAFSILNDKFELGEHVSVCSVPGNLLMPGNYFVTISLPIGNGDLIKENVCAFRIDASDSLASKDGRAGVIAPRLDWSSRRSGMWT